jgi:hypothetical protein
MARRPSFTVTSLDHCYWLPEDESRIPRPARLLRERWRAIVASISQAEPMEYVITRVRCWMRPERKRCPGTIVGNIAPDVVAIGWHCSVCGQGGVIHDWQGRPDDLGQSEINPRTMLIASTDIAVRLPLPIYDAVVDVVRFTVSREIVEVVHAAERRSDVAILHGDYRTLFELRSFIAQEANGYLRLDEERAGRELIVSVQPSKLARTTLLP